MVCGSKFLKTMLITAAVIATVALSSCGGGKKDFGNEKPVVAVSYDSYRWLLKQIVGDSVDIVTLLPAGADPETYEPDIASLMQLQKSVLYLTTNTSGFESRLGGQVAGSFPDVVVKDLSEGINLISGTHEESDPHIMTSVRNARRIAANMLEAISEADTANRDYYGRRCEALIVRLDSLDKALSEGVGRGAVQSGSRTFVVMHPSMSYLARDYNLVQIPMEHGGKEASPRQLHENADKAKAAHPMLFFVEKGHNEAQARELAGYVGAPVVEIYQNDYQWFEHMKSLARSFGNAGK